MRYFELNRFGVDGGYDERWIKVKVWRIPIWLPNTAGRVQAVKLHDLHHVLTEYPTTWSGEAEISAWEIGSGGLKRYYAGWFLDVLNVAQGLVVNPRGMYRAFMRGRSSQNLYSMKFDDEMLTHRVGEFREQLMLDKTPSPTHVGDILSFVGWAAFSVIAYLISVSPVWLGCIIVMWWILS